MEIVYKNKKVEKLCKDYNYAKRMLPLKQAQKLYKAINFIEQASDLSAVLNFRPFNFHDLKGDRKGQYAIDIGSRRDGYRLIMEFDTDKVTVFSKPTSVKIVEIIEMGMHYE